MVSAIEMPQGDQAVIHPTMPAMLIASPPAAIAA
jgi:hypothetical protein